MAWNATECRPVRPLPNPVVIFIARVSLRVESDWGELVKRELQNSLELESTPADACVRNSVELPGWFTLISGGLPRWRYSRSRLAWWTLIVLVFEARPNFDVVQRRQGRIKAQVHFRYARDAASIWVDRKSKCHDCSFTQFYSRVCRHFGKSRCRRMVPLEEIARDSTI